MDRSRFQDPSVCNRSIFLIFLLSCIGEFFANAGPNQLSLFYFSGHGILRGDDVYLATREVDAQKPWIAGFSVSDSRFQERDS